MTKWRILAFKYPSGDNVIDEWYRDQAPEVRARFDSTMEFLMQRPTGEWSRPAANPKFKMLHGPYATFGEIRFKANRVQYRPVGFFSGTGEFTILVIAIEKGGKLPKSLRQILEPRRLSVIRDKGGNTYEWRAMA